MNTQLIADAVRNSRGKSEETVWDRLFAFWFRRLVYTQIWEDPEADLAALRLPVGSTIVTISSGGCNALSYLTARPAQVYAVDLNEAHLSLLQLKLVGLRALSGYAEFWQFFGEGASVANSALYRDRLRPVLDAQTRAYWDRLNIIGRPRHAYFTNGFYRHGMLGRFIGLAHVPALKPAERRPRRDQVDVCVRIFGRQGAGNPDANVCCGGHRRDVVAWRE